MTPEDRELAEIVAGDLYMLFHQEAVAESPRTTQHLILTYIQPALAGETDDTTKEIALFMRAVDHVITACVPNHYMGESAFLYVDSDSVDALTMDFNDSEEIEHTSAGMQELAESMGVELYDKLNQADPNRTVGEIVDEFYQPMFLGLTDDNFADINLRMQAYTLLDARAELNNHAGCLASDYINLPVSDRLLEDYDQVN